MNIHYLELFYYVARHGGISEAVRHMPYGIQQPAISGQVIQLEDFLGVTLFRRRPFALTAAGEELYAFIKPFFDNLDTMAEQLRGGVSQHLRVAASEIVLRDHLPAQLQELRASFPKLKVTLREGYYPQVIDWFQEQEIDISIGLIGSGQPGSGLNRLLLFKLPLVLLVPRSSRLRSADELWQLDRIEDTLITVPSNEPITRAFQEGLSKRKVDWFSGIEVSTLDLIQTYVANGYGLGVTVAVPQARYHRKLRCLPLPDFPMPIFGVLWAGKATPVITALVESLKRTARTLLKGQPGLLLLKE